MDYDVIVAGAGPSGLTVGCETALGGARTLILEKRNGPTWTRAGTLAPRVLEIFASRGIADRFLARAQELHANPYVREMIWAGLTGLRYEALDSDHPYVVMFPQLETERLLAERFRELGGEVRLNHEVTGLSQDDEGVEVRFRCGEGGGQRLRARYLVGADGNRSAVRQAAGIAWHGTPARRIAVNVDAKIHNPYGKGLTVASSERGWAMTYPLRDGVTRFAFIDAATTAGAPDAPLGLEEARAMLRRVHGTDYGIAEVDAINRFHDAMYLAEKIRDRRVFLVGEAVRVHYPASGVGMNFCIQDAFNLGWKLAAAARGRAPEGLLDTYASERLPEIHALLDDVRRQCAIQFNFDAEHRALKGFVEREVIGNPALNLGICENLAGLSANYPAPAGAPAIVGRRLPNLALRDGRRFFDLLIKQEFVELDLSAADTGGRKLLEGLKSVRVRPDGHVASAA